jgi:hypothetical protein
MTIINDEFFSLSNGLTLRVSGIISVDSKGWVRYDKDIFPLTIEEGRILRDHWIRVISDRLGIHYAPAETFTEEHTHETI